MSGALQSALDAIDQAATDPLARAKARGLMRGYDAKWGHHEWRTRSVEEVFHLPIVNPETGRKSRTFTQGGKYDGTAEWRGELWLIEHKTTSEAIEDPNAPYWRQLDIDAQVSAYMLANWQNGDKMRGTLYDVIRKPSIKPKLIDKKERALTVQNRRYFGDVLPDAFVMELAAGQHERETPEMFEARLANDAISTRPEWYYGRKCLSRLDGEIIEYAQEQWDVSQEIANARKKNAWYRNSGACMTYGTPCEFLGICSGHDSPDSDRWTNRASAHSELPIAAGGLPILTHSSRRCFQTCRRKYYYRYELCIERADREEKEALVFGSLLHAGLEGWWKFFMESNHVNDCVNAPIDSVGANQSADAAPVAC